MLTRFLKRGAVLLPGLLVLYVSIFDIFPWLHEHLPLVAALIATYLLGAYVLVPGLIRAWRIVFPQPQVPLYCVTPDGFASDPVNIGLIGTRDQLIAAMTASGWHQADSHSLKHVVHMALSTAYGWSYPNAPMSNLYLFGRPQDVGFEIPIPGGAAGSRHHVRFWATTYSHGDELAVRSIHWHNRRAQVRDDRLLWVGAASRDIGVALIRHNAQLTHMIHPDTDAERQLIINGLKSTGWAQARQVITLGKPYRVANRVWRGYLQTDGQLHVLDLQAPTAAGRSDSSKQRLKSPLKSPKAK